MSRHSASTRSTASIPTDTVAVPKNAIPFFGVLTSPKIRYKLAVDQVVTLEFADFAQHPEITYSVKYKNGHGNKPEGVLAPGGSVKVKEDMIFSVSKTGQS